MESCVLTAVRSVGKLPRAGFSFVVRSRRASEILLSGECLTMRCACAKNTRAIEGAAEASDENGEIRDK